VLAEVCWCVNTKKPSAVGLEGLMVAEGYSAGKKYGDDLLLRPLSGSYHWHCTVSRSCSEWERVLPGNYDHQKGESCYALWAISEELTFLKIIGVILLAAQLYNDDGN
jgi:hypothetical protein